VEYELKDKVIVVTGAGRGLGEAIAVGLAEQGARVCAIDNDETNAERARSSMARVAGMDRVMSIAADVTDEVAVRTAAEMVEARWGRVDALINNAAIMPEMTPVVDLDLETVRRVIDVNLVGYIAMTKHFAPIMVRGGGGRIVYMSSIIGVQANPGQSVYGATKAGITVLNNVVHREMADQGIRTVALAPGLTDTPGMRAIASEEYIDKVAAAYPGGRLGRPADVVAFVSFLCSDAASHLSGTFLPIRPIAG